MTIAACYVSPEGVVFGADSTASLITSPGGFHYFNHNQKLFELGEASTLAALTWGLGSLGTTSYRTLLAELSDDLEKKPPKDVAEVATRFTPKFWSAYSAQPDVITAMGICAPLIAKTQHDPRVAVSPTMRTKTEEDTLLELRQKYIVGFCIGGYVLPDRTPSAFHMQFDPSHTGAPTPNAIPKSSVQFWGAPNIFQRLILGADDNLRKAIQDSPHWTGTPHDVAALVAPHTFGHPVLPIRDAIDFVHACIYSTIKAMKFSNFSQICGGPIELAVITTDRRFRWVRHKEWDAAIDEGVPT